MRDAGNDATEIVSADPKTFHSVVRQSHRPNERAVHVKAFRGSKDGYLFFLRNGILWGFKKPLMFIPLDRVVAVSYTNVLQRTFNIVVEVDLSGVGGGGDAEGAEEGRSDEVEFAMLDQEDYQGIDETYVRRQGLQDRSMAERRKAKRQLAENARGGKRQNGGDTVDGDDDIVADGDEDGHGGDAADGMTALERANFDAEQLLQDDEDELEEDYEPGSDDDGGSGSSSEEEGDEEEEDAEEYDEDEELEDARDDDGDGDDDGVEEKLDVI